MEFVFVAGIVGHGGTHPGGRPAATRGECGARRPLVALSVRLAGRTATPT
jgi:hypothetical protein